MVQTNFTVGNAGSLATVLGEISAGGADAAINTPYNITVTAGVSLSAGVTLDAGSSVTLHGYYPFIIPGLTVTGTVITDLNPTGTITLDNGVLINPALSINSSGTVVEGLFTGTVLGTTGDAGDQVFNSGTIAGSGTYAAIELVTGTVQNGWNGPASALVSGAAGGVQLNAAGLVQNGGTILSTGIDSVGVDLLSSGTIFNGQISDTTALISGAYNGAIIHGAGVLSNDGTITGVASDAVYLASGLVTNGQAGVTTALIDGGPADNGVWIGSGLGTVTNFGTITGGGASGVYLGAGGTVTNGTSGDTTALIGGALDGVLIEGAPGTLLNDGTVEAGGPATSGVIGVFFTAGGTIENLTTSALISGQNWGIAVEGGAGSVASIGTVLATAANSIGVDLTAGGSVTNSGTISGAYYGVRILPGAAAAGAYVLNTGTIEAQTAIDFRHAASLAAGTLVDSGLIESTGGATGNAVVFGAGTEKLVLDPTGTIVGQVIGNVASGSSTTLELAPGTNGTISGLTRDAGTITDNAGSFLFSGIGTIQLDAGASWTVATPGTFDTLDNAGLLSIAGGSVSVATSLSNAGTISLSNGTLTASAGVLADPGIINIGTGGVLKAAGAGITAAGTADIQIGGGADSAMNVTGAGALVNTGSLGLGIGSSGIGSALISQGATVLAATRFASDNAVATGGGLGSTGDLTVTGPGSALLATGQFAVGLAGAGSLLIESQATVTTGNNSADRSEGLDIGQLATGSGQVTVAGTRSALSNAGRFVVGDAGLGSLSIEGGGTVATAPGTVAGLAGAVIAGAAGSDGSSVTVTGRGSDWRVGGPLQVGYAATGELDLSNGASVTASALDAGGQSGGAGIISVSGAGTDLATAGTFSVGDAGAGELSVLGAGSLTIGTDLDIGTAAGGTGNVDIENTAGTVFIGGNLNVGTGGYGELVIGPGVNVYLDNGIENFGPNASVVQFSLIDPPPALRNQSPDDQLKVSGADAFSAYVDNTGGIEITSGHSVAFDTPIVYGAGGAFTIDGNAELVLNADTVTGQTINFGPGSTLVIGQDVLSTIDTPPSGTTFTPGPNPNKGAALIEGGFQDDVLNNFSAGDTIVVTTGEPATFDHAPGGTVVSVVENGATVGALTFFSAAAADTAFTTGGALTDTMLCFLPGTLIRTPSGQAAVEHLNAGDLVLTAAGRARPVAWAGVGRVLATRGRRNAATPVIVRKGALAPNVPHEDLRVTKGHSFLLDGVLVPVEFLVNHRSILWDDRAQEVSVHHVELETHDVLLANGAPAESYRDDGNRWLFRNANTGWDQPPKPPCAPVLTGGPIVDGVWRRLLDRCGPRPGVPLTGDPDLHLLVDGARVDAANPADGVHVFDLPHAPASIRIASRSVVPQELGIARDPRCLGVAVKRIAARQGARFRVALAGDKRLTDGFHDYEADRSLRWTDGGATIPPALFAGFTGRWELVVHVAATSRYADDAPTQRAVA